MKYIIKIRTPDDPTGWTAIGEGVCGTPYQYISGDIAVSLEFPEVKNRWIDNWDKPLSPPRPVPKPSQMKKTRGRKATNDELD